MTKTTNYQLPKWEKTDRIQMSDFNDMTAKLDAALATIPKIAVGTYTGTGKYGTTNKSKLTFPFKPSLVLIFHPADSNYQAVCLPGSDGNTRPFGANTPYLYATWSGNTVSWYSTDADSYQFNSKNAVYCYLAV